MERKEIRLAGSGGQGLILGALILFRAVGLEGRRAAQSQSYEPTSRGGFCHSDVIVTEDPSDYPLVTTLDMVVALAQVGIDRSLGLVKPGALVIVDHRLVSAPAGGSFRLHSLPISELAAKIGSPRIANIIALGALARISGLCSRSSLAEAVRLETPEKFAELNLAAVDAGFSLPDAQPVLASAQAC
jgi:2-oxoglutarate ferredoxin oxidoreductase subunit gamma